MRSFYTDDGGYALAKKVDQDLMLMGHYFQAGNTTVSATNAWETGVIGGDGLHGYRLDGTAIERGLMFVGGASLSYYSTSPLAEWIGGKGLEGLIGFFTGLLGMTLVAKVYEVIAVVDAKEVGREMIAWAKRKWGA